MSEPSVFTKIVNREIPSDIVYEDNEMIAIYDIHPKAPVHILVISKEPIVSLAHAKEQHEGLLGRMLLRVAAIAREQGIEDSGYKVVTNIGREGGQEIPHLHIHLLGGKQIKGLV